MHPGDQGGQETPPHRARRRAAVGILLLFAASLAGLFAVRDAGAIAPGVQLLYPNGGEIMTGGTPQPFAFELNRSTDANQVTSGRLLYRASPADSWSLLLLLDPVTVVENWNVGNFTAPMDDTSTAAIRVEILVENEGVYGDDSDGPLAVDSTAPVMTWVVPGPTRDALCPTAWCAGTNLTFHPAAINLSFTFSEPVDRASLEAATTASLRRLNEYNLTEEERVDLPGADLFFSWNANGTGLRVAYLGPVPGMTLLFLFQNGFRDRSSPGNLGTYSFDVCLDPIWAFLRSCLNNLAAAYITEPDNDAPVAAITQPAGGEYWSAGTTVPVALNVSDDRETPFLDEPMLVVVSYTPNLGNGTIYSGYLPDGAHVVPWTLPPMSYPAYQVHVTAADNGSFVTGGPRSATVSSPPFAIDATPPYVLAASPVNLATDVPLDAIVDVTFSEPLDPAAVEGAFWVLPPGPAPAFAWDPGQPGKNLSIDLGPLLPATFYTWGFQCTLADLSVPGNPVQPCPVFGFTTVNTLPSAAFLGPAPGPAWSGGLSRIVSWSLADATTPVQDLKAHLEYRVDGGAWSHAVESRGLLDFPFAAPCADGASLTLRLTVTDEDGGLANATAGPFLLDCAPPVITTTSPADGAAGVALDASIAITFSEAMDTATLPGCFSVAPDPGNVSATWTPDGRTVTLAHGGLAPSVVYAVSVCPTARDTSLPGLELGGAGFSFATVANAPPTVSLALAAPTQPSPGAAVTLQWDAADAEDATLATQLDYDLGTGFVALDSGVYPVGTLSLPWTLPPSNGTVSVRACVTDSWGASACDVQALLVDGLAPTVAPTPADGATAVDRNAPLLLTFSEPMAAVDAGLWLETAPAMPSASGRWIDATTFELAHGPLDLGATYAVRLGCALRDAASPGNPLAGCPQAVTFTVEQAIAEAAFTEDHFAVDRHVTIALPPDVLPTDVGAVLVGGVATGNYSWTIEAGQPVLEIDAPDLELCTDYRVTLADLLGLPVWERAFRTECAPAVTVDVDAEGVVRGGAILLVSWNVTDEDGSSASLFLNYSAVGGVDGFPAQVFAETLATGVNALSWKVPALDSLGLVLRLTAVDADGHVGWNSTRTLQVDSTPPVPFLRHTGNLTAGSRLTFDASASFDAVSSIARYRWRFWSEAKGLLGLATDVTAAHSFEAAGDYLVTLEVWDAAGNVAAKTERIPIGSASGTGGDVTVVAAAGGSALGLLALAGGAAATSQPVRTWGLKHLILPLYVRLKPDAVSNQQTRGMIIGYIKVHPGDSYSDIKNNLELSSGALTYHLDVLERERLVRSRNKGSRKLYYPADASMPEDGGGLHELQLRMLKVAEEQPGLSVRDLSGVLGVRPQLAIYHARVLQLSGRIRLERVGLRTRVYRVRDGVVVREAKAPDT